MTKSQQIEIYESEEQEMLSKFCPLINAACRPECACFHHFVVNGKEDQINYSSSPWCTWLASHTWGDGQ